MVHIFYLQNSFILKTYEKQICLIIFKHLHLRLKYDKKSFRQIGFSRKKETTKVLFLLKKINWNGNRSINKSCLDLNTIFHVKVKFFKN